MRLFLGVKMLIGSKICKNITVLVILFLCVLAVFITFKENASAASYTIIDHSPVIEISTGWEYYDNDTKSWKNFKYPGRPNIYPESQIILERIILPSGQWRDPCLFIKSEDQDMEVYLDGRLIYFYGNSFFSSEKKAPGSPWQIIQLPEDFQGKKVVLRMHSLIPGSVGVLSRAYIGSKFEFITGFVKKDMPDTIMASLFIIFGIGILFMIFMNMKQRKVLMSTAFFSICIGIWVFSETNIIKQLLINNQVFWVYSGIISAYLMPVGFCLSMQNFFQGIQKTIIMRLWQIYIVFTAVSIIIDLTGLKSIIFTVQPYNFLLIATMLIIGTFIINGALKGSYHLRVLLFGFIGLASTGLYDILGWIFKIIPWTHHIAGYGMLTFIISLLFILDRSIAETSIKLESYSKEIKLKEITLQENEKMLNQAAEYDKLKNEFIANISHEFRTPLNIILGNLQLMNFYIENGSITSKTKDVGKYVKAMRQNCFRLLKLINNIIDITKIDSGHLEPVFINCNIVELARELVLSTSNYAESRDLSLFFKSNRADAVIACDPEKLERIFLNLLSNAVKFTKPGGSISVGIDCRQDTVYITVSDTGIGIPLEKQDTIFERFSQVDGLFTRNYEGSGIGLSLVRSLVEMQGGKISVESEYGKGSVFTLELPIKSAVDVKDQSKIENRLKKSYTDLINIEFSDIN